MVNSKHPLDSAYYVDVTVHPAGAIWQVYIIFLIVLLLMR